jgi:hypothetical protein
MLYFTEFNKIWRFNPYTKESNIVYTFDVPEYSDQAYLISRGFHFNGDKAWFTVVNEVPSSTNNKLYNQDMKCIAICVDTTNWTLVKYIQLFKNIKYDQKFVLSSIKYAVINE